MSELFWITGLPRTRTAWWSAAMDLRGVAACEHELAARTTSLEHWCRELQGSFSARRGTADSAAGLHIVEIMRKLAPRTLIVDRGIGDVRRSMIARFGEEPPGAQQRLVRLSNALSVEHPLIKRVDYADLGEPEVIEECVRWLVPDSDLLVHHALKMMRFNVQVTHSQALALAKREHTLWHLEEVS